MGMGDRGWRDSTENYCDSYVLNVVGSTATAVLGQDYSQPVAVVGLSVTLNSAIGSGDIVLRDGSATADSDAQKWRVVVASGIATGKDDFVYSAMFPRPISFNSGLIVSATTVTGSISILYKPRYS